MEELVKKYRDAQYDLSCSEAILHAANEKYQLGLDDKTLRVASGFSGGMLCKKTCGIVSASIIALGLLYTDKVCHQSPRLKQAVNRYIELFEAAHSTLECGILKEQAYQLAHGCNPLIIEGAKLLEQVADEFNSL